MVTSNHAAPIDYSDLLDLPTSEPSAVIRYGEAQPQFGELWLPPNRQESEKRFPVVVLFHGGCWSNAYGLNYTRAASAALAAEGFAVWSLEYRRVGDTGGGWPGTFMDAEFALSSLQKLAQSEPLDLTQVSLVGHSAGGHLALWAAARNQTAKAIPIQRVVGLSAIVDLQRYASPRGCGSLVEDLMGGSPASKAMRYAEVAKNINSLISESSIPIKLLYGLEDGIVPFAHGQLSVEALGLDADKVISLEPNTGHFDWFDPGSQAWRAWTESLKQ